MPEYPLNVDEFIKRARTDNEKYIKSEECKEKASALAREKSLKEKQLSIREAELRNASLEIVFSDPKTFEMEIKTRDFFEQKIIIEKNIQSGYLPIEKILNLLDTTENCKTKMAVIENLSRYQNLSGKIILIKKLINLANGDIPGINYEADLKNSELEEYFFEKYPSICVGCCQSKEKVVGGIIQSVAVANLKKFSSLIEKPLIEDLKNLKKTVIAGEVEFNEQVIKIGFKKKEPWWNSDDDKNDWMNDESRELYDENFKLNSLKLKILSELGSKKSIDFCINVIEKNLDSVALYKKELLAIFQINPDYSAQKLLELIGNKNIGVKKRALIMLYRLDFSQIGISEEDMKHLEKKYNLDNDNILDSFNHLEKTKIEIEFLAEVLKNLPEEEKKNSTEVIKGLDFEQKKVADLSEEEKKQIIENAKKNWQKDNPEVADEIISHLKGELHPETEEEKEIAHQSNGHLLKYNNEVIGFAKFKPLSETEVYAGSLNIHISLRGAEIGKQFFEKVLKEELPKGKIIVAETSLRNPATVCYVEKFNFVIDGIIPDSYGKGHPFFTIRIEKNLNKNLKTKNADFFGLEEIKNLFREQENSELSPENLIKEKNIIVFKLNKNPHIKGCPNEEKLKKLSQEILPEKDDDGNLIKEKKNKFIGTRYLYDKKESCWYVVLEKVN